MRPALKALFVVNPVSGGGRGLRVWGRVREELDRRGLASDARLTTAPGEATRLAAEGRRDGYGLIVAVGGDGTVHQVVNGMVDAEGKCPGVLGVVPGGTGNDFSKLLGYPGDPVKALDVVFGGRERVLDLGRVNGHYYVNIAGVGFDAEICAYLNSRPKRLPAALTYVSGVLRMLFRYSPAPVTLVTDSLTLERKCLLVSVCNGPSHGGGMKMSPEAKPDDGLLDICIGGDLGRLETVLLLPRVFSGTHVRHPKVEILRARKLRIESSHPLFVQADGEVLGQVPASFEVVPRVLRVMAASDPAPVPPG